jgi:hypothetical protein
MPPRSRTNENAHVRIGDPSPSQRVTALAAFAGVAPTQGGPVGALITEIRGIRRPKRPNLSRSRKRSQPKSPINIALKNHLPRKMSGANTLAPSNSAFVYPTRRQSHEAIAASPRRALGKPDPGPRHHPPAQNCAVLSLRRPQFSCVSPHYLSPPAQTLTTAPQSPSPRLVPVPLPAISPAAE